MVSNFILMRNQDTMVGTFLKRKSDCIDTSGKNIMVKFLKVIMFIIRIKTSLITTLII